MTDWWRCPNIPPCPHAGLFHDIDDRDDPLPTCCIGDCPCGKADNIDGVLRVLAEFRTGDVRPTPVRECPA